MKVCVKVCVSGRGDRGVFILHVIKTRWTFNMQRSTTTHLPLGKLPCRLSHFSISVSLCVCLENVVLYKLYGICCCGSVLKLTGDL